MIIALFSIEHSYYFPKQGHGDASNKIGLTVEEHDLRKTMSLNSQGYGRTFMRMNYAIEFIVRPERSLKVITEIVKCIIIQKFHTKPVCYSTL